MRQLSGALAQNFAAAIAGLGPWGNRAVAVAVSGGADSLALALLAHDWCAATGRAMLVLSVDHGLRAAAAGEARHVAAVMAGRGIACRILTLGDLAAGPGIAARAREARYRAMAAACFEAGIVDLLLGHHAADQAETLLIRREGASGLRGLAGMSGVFLRDGLRVIRPLLGVEPEVLRDFLRSRAVAWVEDPSNHDRRATRVRLRAGLTAADIGPLAAAAHAAGVQRIASETEAAAWMARHVTFYPAAYVRIASPTCPPECLAALIQAVSGAAYPPASAALARLAGGLRPATLAGVRLMAARRGGGFWLLREQAAIAASVVALDKTIWDQRFKVVARGDLPAGATIGALGDEARLLRDGGDLPAAILRTLPAFRSGDLLSVPFLPPGRHNAGTGARVVFAPARPAAGGLFRVAGERGDA